MERKTGFEPATPTLARWCSTTELLPHVAIKKAFSFLRNLSNNTFNKASKRARTADLFLTMEVLYLLSYGSNGSAGRIRTYDRSVNSR